jgi:hypothetical protein
LCSALEGGSNYWYTIVEFVQPNKFLNFSDVHQHDERKLNPEIYRHLDYPTNPGGALVIKDKEDEDGKLYRLDLNACARGLQVMQEKYPRHFGAFLSEDDDAETGDVFLQCCLLGDVVYG